MPQRVSVREVVIEADEMVTIAGQRVTSPVRTIADLARFDDDVSPRLLARLAAIGTVSLDDCRSALDRRRNLPNKLVAWRRIRDAIGAQPELTR